MDARPSARISQRRLLAFCACLCAGLLAANLVYSTLERAKPVLSGTGGQLLYVSAFDAYADEWDISAGQHSARIVDAQLEISVADAQTAAWSAASPRFADFDLRVTATAHEGPIDNAFGMIFHLEARDESACDLPAILLCGLGDLLPLAGAALRQVFGSSTGASYLAFLISSDGYYSLWQADGGSSLAISAWIPSPHIRPGLGQPNRLRVIARDNHYRFEINSQPAPLCIANDRGSQSTYAGGLCIDGSMRESYHVSHRRSGQLGMIAQATATGGGGPVIRFDDMLVTAPGSSGSGEARL